MRPHYLAREPALAIPFVAIAANLLLLLFVSGQLRSTTARLNLRMEAGAPFSSASQLVITTSGTAVLNGSAMSNLQELELHLSGIASNSSGLAVQVPANISGERLAEALRTCNRAGFTDVALSVKPSRGETLQPQP